MQTLSESNPNNSASAITAPPAPPLPMPALLPMTLAATADADEQEKRLASEFKVRNLMNELLQTGNEFQSICQKLAGVFIRNYFLIAQHIPTEKLNDVILNFFTLATIPKKTGYMLAHDPQIPSLKEITRIEKKSHAEILHDFFPQYDAQQKKFIASPAVNEMLEKWGALSQLTVFYYGSIGLLGATVFEDKFVSPTEESKKEFLKGFSELFDRLVAHCDHNNLSTEVNDYRRFMLLRSLVRDEGQWQSVLDKLVPLNDADTTGLSRQQKLMQYLAANPYAVAKEIFSMAEERRFMSEQTFQLMIKNVIAMDNMDKGNNNSIFHVMIAVMWAKNTNSLKNGTYPNDFDLVTQQTITSFQRLTREEMFFASIKKLIPPESEIFIVAEFIHSEVNKLVHNINADICVMVYKSDLFGAAIEQIDAILKQVAMSNLMYSDFVQVRASYFVVRTRFLLSGGKDAKGYVDEGAVTVICAMYTWLKGEFLFDETAAAAALKDLKNQSVIKDETRLGLELRRLKTLAAAHQDNIGEKFFHDPSRIQFRDKGNKLVWKVKQRTPVRVLDVKAEEVQSPTRVQATAERTTAPQPQAQILPKQTYFRGGWNYAPPLPPPSPEKNHGAAPARRRQRKGRRLHRSSSSKKSSAAPIVLAAVLAVFFLLSVAALMGTLASGQLPFDTSMFQLDFMRHVVKFLAWSKAVFLGVFIAGASALAGMIIGAIVMLVAGLVRDYVHPSSKRVIAFNPDQTREPFETTEPGVEQIVGDAYSVTAVSVSSTLNKADIENNTDTLGVAADVVLKQLTSHDHISARSC